MKSIRPSSSSNDGRKAADLSLPELARRLRNGDRRALARAITLAESLRPDHRQSAVELLKSIMPYTGASFRIGISGVPGVGKSSFIEVFGNYLIELGFRVAVLAVDPSSPISGGAILGDKTRMESLARQDNAFIRPSAAGGTLGGVTRRTREALLLCEAAGFDIILVETVGVGQSETSVAQMTDLFVLLLLPGGGDDLQGIKRGVTEMADLILINKADGDLYGRAQHTAADYRSALHFLRSRTKDWTVPVQTCSALDNQGIDEVWSTVQKYRQAVAGSNALERKRGRQARSWFWDEISEQLTGRLKQHPELRSRVIEVEQQVVAHEVPPTVAAQELVDTFFDEDKS